MLEILKSIGLTDAEAKVYTALLDLGTTTIGPLADKSKVSYSKIYLLLEKLIDKGLASYMIKEKTKYFSAGNPKKILEYLELKKSSIDKQKSEIEKIMPEIEARMKLLKEKEYMTIYEGYEGFKTAYYESMQKLAKGEEVLVMGATAGQNTGKRYSLLFKKIHEERNAKGIIMHIIFNEDFRKNNDIGFYKKQKNTKVRFLLKETPCGINIQGERVMIIYWQKEEPKIFLINSKVVADSFRKYFEVIWAQARGSSH